jgi:Zn-dependent peptidase ImmA (M78 family)
MSARVAVAPSVLRWAQERSKRDDGAYESKFPAWPYWVAGQKEPTIKQVADIASYSHLPFGIFFLDQPPEIELPIPDYRLGREGDEAAPSQDLLDVIDLSVQRQAWFWDHAIKLGLGPASVTRATLEDEPSAVAAAAARELDYTVAGRARMSRGDARNHLRRRFEERGGLAIFTSMVGNDNHRMLDRGEFRGFTLADEVSPLIFVNSSDESLSGQIFTFLHEYAHVVLRATGISDEDPAAKATGVEAWCNAVAAEVLVPAADLKEQFRLDVPMVGELDRLSSRYLCSTLVILLKARDLGLVPSTGFDAVYRAEEARAVEAFEYQRAQSGGGEFYANQPFRIGERLSRAVLSDVREGGTTYTEAFRILGLRNVEQLNKYATHLGI